MLNALLSISIA